MNSFIENLHLAYQTVFPQGTKVTARAHGIDISKYDLHFKPEDADGQLDFVVQRISYRTTRDEAFDKLVGGVMLVPIRGGYHYLNTDTSWLIQADKFLGYVKGFPYHFFACDFEAAFNTLSVQAAYQAWEWIHYVQERTGLPVLLYTSPDLYNRFIIPSGKKYGLDWNTVDLWTAQWFYTPNPNGKPTMPAGRTAGWKIWQYTAKGTGPLYGVARPNTCDLDVFNGTPQEMAAWLNITPVEPEPEDPTEGDDLMAISDEAVRYLADQYYKGLHEIAEALKGQGTDDDDTTPPPADDGRSKYVIRENDPNPNDMVKVYKSPDTNETNLETVWAKNGVNSCVVFDSWEDVPGHPVWNSFSELDKINTYRDWRAIDCKATKYMVNGGGKSYEFPAQIRYNSGAVPEVVWIRKADLGAKIG